MFESAAAEVAPPLVGTDCSGLSKTGILYTLSSKFGNAGSRKNLHLSGSDWGF